MPGSPDEMLIVLCTRLDEICGKLDSRAPVIDVERVAYACAVDEDFRILFGVYTARLKMKGRT